ncbi:transmembrane protein 248-like isoform X1 [Haemaphysalis longicornis]
MTVAQHLRGLALSHPPLLVFSGCLVAFGVTMIVLAYIIGGTELPNPDIDMDWNVLLTRLSELHYCVGPRSEGPPANGTAAVPGVKAVDRAKSLSALLPDLGGSDPQDEGGRRNITVAVAVPEARFSREALKGGPVIWHAHARGYMLGLAGQRAREGLSLTLILWPQRLNESCTEGRHCRVDTCLILQGPAHLLPQTSRRPPRCFLEAVPPSVSRPVFLQRSAADTRVNCTGGVWASFLYTPRPELTVMLSYGDRSLVNLHLIHTSYLLFFVVMTLVCYAVIRFHRADTGNKVVDA